MKKLMSIIAIAAMLLPFGTLAEHHEDERGPLTDVWVMVPKQGMEAQFEEAAAAHMAYRTEQGDSRDWQAYRVVVGSKLNVYQWRYCCFDWGDHDGYIVEDQEKGLGANWNENVHQYVDHYHHYMDEMDWENSHWPQGEERGPYYGVTSWAWKMGAGPGPSEARKKLSQIAKKEGWGEAGNRWLWHERVGGKPTLMIAASFKDFADMAPPEQSFFEFLSEHMDSPEEVSALFTEFGSGFSSSDYTVWMHDEKLSAPNDD